MAGPDVSSATKLAMRSLARRIRDLDAEIAELDAVLGPLVEATAPDLVTRPGLGPDTAGALLVAAGDNPHRLRNEATFAHLCGASPLDASSGKQLRHRLNRGGDRQANATLWRIVITRLASDPRTRHYVERRRKDGLTKTEAIRCLKRYVAREVFYYSIPWLDIPRSIERMAGARLGLPTPTSVGDWRRSPASRRGRAQQALAGLPSHCPERGDDRAVKASPTGGLRPALTALA